MKILTIANRKGGAGKSTCAAHFSIEAVREGMKTILIDLDPQKTLEKWWEKRVDQNPYLTDAGASDLEEKLNTLKGKGFDLCIIDTPGDTSANATAAIKASDLIVIPSKPTGADLTAIGRTLQFILDERKSFVFLITQAIPNTKDSLQAASILSGHGMVAPSVMMNRVCYQRALAEGISAVEIEPVAKKEVGTLWKFVSGKVFGKDERGNNGKAKI